MISGSWHQFKANWMILFWTLPYVFARSSQEMTLCLLRCFREIKCMLLQPGTQNSRKKTLQMWMCCYLDCYVNWNHQRGWWNRDGTPTNSQMVIARTSWTVDIFQRVQWHLFCWTCQRLKCWWLAATTNSQFCSIFWNLCILRSNLAHSFFVFSIATQSCLSFGRNCIACVWA